ncbi:hypothetical protein [Allorhizocola rhizosphaerae]|uniref:hypothetical protein n=1 Tax=Allorhizocola rhizosphaerae TaxID=1872709 RepID=UPI000E3DE6AA|nr:hypothetical protein [Allorhizocola rhizosphaerae]
MSQLPHAVFPDWSPYTELDAAARAYLRDPEVALEVLAGVLGGGQVRGFTLERFVNEHNGVWQEAVVCDGSRLLLWHGEDVATDDPAHGAMISSLRVVPLSAVIEVGCRRRLARTANGQLRVDSVDVYLLLNSIDEAPTGPMLDDARTVVRQDALRFGKTLEDGGPGQIARLEEFARLVASLVGRPLV